MAATVQAWCTSPRLQSWCTSCRLLQVWCALWILWSSLWLIFEEASLFLTEDYLSMLILNALTLVLLLILKAARAVVLEGFNPVFGFSSLWLTHLLSSLFFGIRFWLS